MRMHERRQPRRPEPDRFELWTSRIVRVLGVIFGFAGFSFEVLKDRLDRPYVLGASLALIEGTQPAEKC